MKDDNFDKNIDWESLAEKMKDIRIKHSKVMAVMPSHPPIRILSNMAEGIYPIKEMFEFSKK